MTVDKQTTRRILRKGKGICHLCGRPGASDVDQVLEDSGVEALAPVHRECRWKRRRAA